MFANTQMMGLDTGFPDVPMSPLRVLGLMARRTDDPAVLNVLQAGLQAMLSESMRSQAYLHDQGTARVDLAYMRTKIARSALPTPRG